MQSEPRDIISERFLNEIKNSSLSSSSTIRVAVLGGYLGEPELLILQDHYKLEVTYFGVEGIAEHGSIYLDLNDPPINIEIYKSGFDLVLCSQVLEHLWSVNSAFECFTFLLSQSGYLWVACPFSNFLHGSPAFYSAGYSPDLLKKMAEKHGLNTISIGSYANKRLYRARHLLIMWPSRKQLAHPILTSFSENGTLVSKFIARIRTLPARLILSITPNKEVENQIYAVESFGLFQNE
jgi:hypothetical protein